MGAVRKGVWDETFSQGDLPPYTYTTGQDMPITPPRFSSQVHQDQLRVTPLGLWFSSFMSVQVRPESGPGFSQCPEPV